MTESSITNTIINNLKRFLRREGGSAPIAPLINKEHLTPLQDIRDRNQQKGETPHVAVTGEKKE